MGATELTEDQRRRIEHATPRVLALARALAPQIPQVAQDDLVSAGYEGLVQAALRYDPASGVPFTAFAHYRVRGAMLDAARRAVPALRRRSRALKALEATQALLEHSAKASAPTERGDARSLEERIAAAAELVARTTTAVLVSKLAPADPDLLQGGTPDAETVLLQTEAHTRLRDALESFPPSDRDLVDALYVQGLTMHEYAKQIGKSTSTVSRHHTRIIDRLGKRLSHRADPPVRK